MRIVALSDTHNQHRKVQVPPGDVVIHAGDFCINGTEDEALDFVQWFRELPHRHKIFIGGNHDAAVADMRVYEDPPSFRTPDQPGMRNADPGSDIEMLLVSPLSSWDAHYGGTLYLEGTTASICVGDQWARIHGAPWRPRPNDWTQGSPTRPSVTNAQGHKRSSAFGVRENAIARYWDTIPPRTDVLITHVPAYEVLDMIEETPTSDALRIGCGHLRTRLQRMRAEGIGPQVHIFGHVHDPGGQHVVTAEGTRAYNVAICDANYNPTHQPQVIDL